MNQVRATFDAQTITVYQAFGDAIADAALAQGRFAPPFSFGRMTWVKPQLLWLMERSQWAQKTHQTRILAVRLKRTGWDEALRTGVLTHPEPSAWPDPDGWRRAFAAATVHVQWDTDRGLRGEALQRNAIQVGIGRAAVERFNTEWVAGLEDLTPRVMKMAKLLKEGRADAAKRLLPEERPYPVDAAVGRRLGM